MFRGYGALRRDTHRPPDSRLSVRKRSWHFVGGYALPTVAGTSELSVPDLLDHGLAKWTSPIVVRDVYLLSRADGFYGQTNGDHDRRRCLSGKL
jgi:hypothetical protein